MTHTPHPNEARPRTTRVVGAAGNIPASSWNALLSPADPPFLRHEFLLLLEATGCVGQGTGWSPCHMVMEVERGGKQEAVGAIPLYLKEHSYGEYVFDWAWARAYQQHGIAYYPKLISAIPFTPVTTRKLLLAADTDDGGEILLAAVRDFARDNPISSVHALFLESEETDTFLAAGFLERHDNQFHWHNEGYEDFEHYLSRFTSKRRKNIRAERRAVAREGVDFHWLKSAHSGDRDWEEMYELYRATIAEHGGIPYLTRGFFLELRHALPDHALLLKGMNGREMVCGALFFQSNTALFGRYWGASRFISNLHFETCYYQPIAYAIDNGLARFEAGAQGIHKLSRGLAPSQTRSAHWLKHPAFYDAVDRYLRTERNEQTRYNRLLKESLPFKARETDDREQ